MRTTIGTEPGLWRRTALSSSSFSAVSVSAGTSTITSAVRSARSRASGTTSESLSAPAALHLAGDEDRLFGLEHRFELHERLGEAGHLLLPEGVLELEDRHPPVAALERPLLPAGDDPRDPHLLPVVLLLHVDGA